MPEVSPENLQTVFTRDMIQKRVGELAQEISTSYAGKHLLAVCVLKGAVTFFVDLMRSVEVEAEFEFVRLASYADSTCSSGELIFSSDLATSIQGKHVLIVEDIVDTGRSMDFLKRTFAQRYPASIALAALIAKTKRRECLVEIDFTGFCLHDGFFVGYGMDYAEKYRSLEGIYCLPENSELVAVAEDTGT